MAGHFHRNQATLHQLTQRRIQRLLADRQNAQQGVNAQARMAAHKIQHPMMHPLQAALGQHLVWQGGKRTKTIKEQFQRLVERRVTILVNHVDYFPLCSDNRSILLTI